MEVLKRLRLFHMRHNIAIEQLQAEGREAYSIALTGSRLNMQDKVERNYLNDMLISSEIQPSPYNRDQTPTSNGIDIGVSDLVPYQKVDKI